MEKLLRLIKEQNDLLNPNDELSQLIASHKKAFQLNDDELDIDQLDMVVAARKIPDFVPDKHKKDQ